MDIVINLQPIYEFLSLPADIMLLRFLYLFGWIPFAVVILWGLKEIWLNNVVQNIYGSKQKFILLAIDVPRGNSKSPRAVEDMFNYLAGAHGSINLIEKYWEGKFQLSFSLEIVSIEGYTQFLIHTPEGFRNLVESAVYAQYPDAEITEVNDYTANTPNSFPDEEYDLWGAEYVLAKDQMFPIKTYPEFEHQFGAPEELFKDPLAALMDLNSSLKKGEQLWYQIIIRPIDMIEWTKGADAQVGLIMKEKPASTPDITDSLLNILGTFSEWIYSIWGDIPEKKEEKKDDPLKMMNLKPNQKNQVEAIYRKASKIGFDTKIRMVYLAKKEVMNKSKVANGFTGFIKQFASLELNNIKPDMAITATSTSYFMKKERLWDRQTKIIRRYKGRTAWGGKMWKVMNVEELATLWHFPIEAVVKAPLIQKAPGRKAEPPMGLPISAETVGRDLMEPVYSDETKELFALEKSSNGDRASVGIQNSASSRAEAGIIKIPAETNSKGAPPMNLPWDN